MDESIEITHLAKQYWQSENAPFHKNIAVQIYDDFMLKFGFAHRQIQQLEFTQYLEKYLWPNISTNCQKEIVLSVCVIVNEKLSEKVNAWDIICSNKEGFSCFFRSVLELILNLETLSDNRESTVAKDQKKRLLEKIVLIQFLNNCFVAMTEDELIFAEIKHLLSMGMWTCLSPTRLDEELSKDKKYKKIFKKIQSEKKPTFWFKCTFLPKLIDLFLVSIDAFDKSNYEALTLRYFENLLVLFITLESMLASRRYLNAVIEDKYLIVRAQKSQLTSHSPDDESTKLFCQLLEMLDFYVNFEIDEISGETLTESQLECRHREKLVKLQKEAFKKFKDPMRQLWISNCDTLEQNNTFTRILSEQSEIDLQNLAVSINLIADGNKERYSKDDLIRMFSYSFKKRSSTLYRINNLALYPTEDFIYDDNLIPEGYFSVEQNFAIPRLGIQYLSFHDYLMRNFDLFRLEAAYEIKQDIEHCLHLTHPVLNETNEVIFRGWSRMAMPIDGFQIIEVGKPEIGRNYPRVVRADVTLVLNCSDTIRREWESLAKHDPCFLITVCPKEKLDHEINNKELMATQVGLMYVRGCEIEGILDKDGKVISEEEKRTKLASLSGQSRTWRVKLDPCQYNDDVINDDSDTKDVYGTFNIFMRRKPKENNFKAVLETIRDLMNDEFVVPSWLQNLLLGYDHPAAAHYTEMKSQYITKQNWGDTFLDFDHLIESFPQYSVKISSGSEVQGPYQLIFPHPEDDKSLKPIQMHEKETIYNTDNNDNLILNVEPYKPPLRLAQKFTDPLRWGQFNSLPAIPVEIPGNRIRFTPTQIEAIRSGMQHGLTLVVGPPGTGKTDVAVQIINNIYRNYPNQRTLIVTHSNQALNQLFEKIMNLGIDERHLLRLGHGEEALETTKDFSKYGRVNYVLWKRLYLLREVEKLSASLDCIQLDPNETHEEPLYTCETAQHFFLSEVMPRWATFQKDYSSLSSSTEGYPDGISYEQFIAAFPFLKFFIPSAFHSEQAVRELFSGASLTSDLAVANTCFRHLLDMFIELDDFRSFELMRNGLSRANSLLVQHAKIIAMTCTHAALRRRDLIQLGFTYDNILIEEAAQILEIETFIPLLLQKPDRSKLNRLKRWVMIGDHNQLPPVIKNMVFQTYCNMSQSMFSRLVKLGVPHVQLNAQGRSRPHLRQLYSWRYKVLQDLPSITAGREFVMANPGLLYDYQLINVDDYKEQGETEPTPHFVQNLAEAEYCVALYMYLRAIGYPASRITILTTYNGQKHLIRDVLRSRCGDVDNQSKVVTVDRFQGQQNDYIILSLVRTKTVGHLRDIRRLVVAMSRARLGLYIFCRVDLFSQCRELQGSFSILQDRSTKLSLVSNEHYSFLDRYLSSDDVKVRLVNDTVDNDQISRMKDVQHMCKYVETIYSSFKIETKEQLLPVKRQSDIDDENLMKKPKIDTE